MMLDCPSLTVSEWEERHRAKREAYAHEVAQNIAKEKAKAKPTRPFPAISRPDRVVVCLDYPNVRFASAAVAARFIGAAASAVNTATQFGTRCRGLRWVRVTRPAKPHGRTRNRPVRRGSDGRVFSSLSDVVRDVTGQTDAKYIAKQVQYLGVALRKGLMWRGEMYRDVEKSREAAA